MSFLHSTSYACDESLTLKFQHEFFFRSSRFVQILVRGSLRFLKYLG